MDLDLDDLDFENDEIKRFLKHKLQEIEDNNAKIERTISERRTYLQKILDDTNAGMDDSSASISFAWKKVFNEKYALGFTIQNNDRRFVKNIKVFLKWTASKPLSYDVIIFNTNTEEYRTNGSFICNDKRCKRITENVLKSEEVSSVGYIVIVLDIPKFTRSLEEEITGNIICLQGHRELNLAVPTVRISPSDATDRQVTEIPISNGVAENLLTAISCSSRIDLVLALSQEWSSPVDSTFEIHCSLTKVETPSCCRKYFLAHRVSPVFDNSVVEIHAPLEGSPTVYRCAIYSRDNISLMSLLHHLHLGITGVTILPIQFYENIILRNSGCSSAEILEEFKKSAIEEMKLVGNFLSPGDKTVAQFRYDLIELEKETDMIHLKICRLNSF